jgi:uncharacterized protein
MSRIQKAYENKFRAMLGCVRPRKLDKAVGWFRGKALQLAAQRKIPATTATAEVYERARQRLARWRLQHGGRPGISATLDPPRFLCDAGLGGLARWLRAAGYEARWIGEGAQDDDLLDEAQRWPCILLTTDSLLMERRVLRDGIIPSLWVSPSLRMREQLQIVLGELNLPIRDPRCMRCGGVLVEADKEKYREQLPPKTYRWLDEFFMCQGCGQLFWHGTHWEKIKRKLEQANPRCGRTTI